MTERERLCHRIRRRAERLRAELFPAVFAATLKGMCAICTIALGEAFKARGWPCRAYYGTVFLPGEAKGRMHCWLEDEDCIYDLTATQFGADYPAVLIVPATDERYRVRQWQVELDGDYWKYAPQHERQTAELLAMLLQGEKTDAWNRTSGRSRPPTGDGTGGLAG